MSPMERPGGTSIRSYRADIQRVKGRRRKATIIKNRALGLLAGRAGAVSPGMSSFL